MWKIYDELIDGIDENLIVEDYLVGIHRTYVATSDSIGFAMTFEGNDMPTSLPLDLKGMSLKELARLSKSWNFIEASLGVASINAYYNQEKNIPTTGKNQHGFDFHIDAIRGKKVAIIGHFKKIEEDLAPYCKLSVLERLPLPGDYPDSACEYILPEQDIVIMTGATFVNKTFPRLAELSQHAEVIILGPTTPLTPLLAKYGVNHLSGFIAQDINAAKQIVKQGGLHPIFSSGKKVNLTI